MATGGEPDAALKPARTYDEVQADIDRVEDELEAGGINPTRLFYPDEHSRQTLGKLEEWSEMPADLAKLYDERDAIGSAELKRDADDLHGRLTAAGLNEAEANRILREQYNINRERTDAASQYMASTFTVEQTKKPYRKQAEQIYMKLAAERGVFMDDADDLWRDRKTTEDALRAAKAIVEAFGGTIDENFNPGQRSPILRDKPQEQISAEEVRSDAGQIRQDNAPQGRQDEGGQNLQLTAQAGTEAGGAQEQVVSLERQAQTDAPLVFPKMTRPLKRIKVTRPAVEEGTWRTTTVEQRADEAIADVEGQITSIKEFIACLRS